MKLRYSPRATNDIIAIADYLTVLNPSAAQKVELAIRRTVDLIGEFPASGRALTQRPEVRIMPVPRLPYLIFYMSAADELVVLHIRHGARAPVKPERL